MQLKAEILQLAALRQSKAIALDVIAERTKISRYYLRAIEELDLAKLPGGVYRDNFLIQYAQAIDEDLAEELQRKLALATKEAAEAQAKSIQNSGVMRTVKEMLARGAALLFLVGPGSLQSGEQAAPTSVPAEVRKDDPRFEALSRFFRDHKCPILDLAADFIAAADRNGLDWRLLPSIAFLESSGGKHLTGKNLMGWGSGNSKFKTARQGIYHVAERLAHSPIYAGKDLRTKLRIYNPANKQYAVRVVEIMNRLAPGAESLLAAR